MTAEITQEEPKTKEDITSRITKESILQGAIDDIDKLEKSVKSAKTLVDLLILHRDMHLTLASVGLKLGVFQSMLKH
jgi:hypothetical protein